MNAGAPTCSTCGGVNTNPQAAQCRFCGQALAPQGHGAPRGYGAHAAQGYGAPGGYGGGAPGGYDGGAPGGYGAPQAPQGYAQPYGGPQPNVYGGPPPSAYGSPHVPVAGFGGVQPMHHGYVNRGSAWSTGLSTFFWVRIVIAVIAIGVSLLGACVSAIAH